jgi:hypothetical protein
MCALASHSIVTTCFAFELIFAVIIRSVTVVLTFQSFLKITCTANVDCFVSTSK